MQINWILCFSSFCDVIIFFELFKTFHFYILGHIQAVYVQNSLKLFCYIAEKMLEADETDKAKQVLKKSSN